MQNHLNDTLYNTAEAVFENLAFVLTMPEGDEFADFDMSDFEPASFDEEDPTTDIAEASENSEPQCFDTEEECEEEFESIDFDDDFGSTSSGETILASIHFCGACEGDLFLEASEELLPIIGMNMLGLDDENALTHEEQKDAFRELLNVICGNLLPAIAGEKAVFNIDSAELHSETVIPETFEGKSPLAHSHFGLEVGYAKLALFANDEIYQLQGATV